MRVQDQQLAQQLMCLRSDISKLKIEQTSRDENVAEYLKLVNSADKQQMGRIRQVRVKGRTSP